MTTGWDNGGGSRGIIWSGDEGDVNDEPPIGQKRLLVQPRGISRIEDGIAAFGSSMREVELAKIDLGKKRLRLEERWYNDLMCEREADRKAQVPER